MSEETIRKIGEWLATEDGYPLFFVVGDERYLLFEDGRLYRDDLDS